LILLQTYYKILNMKIIEYYLKFQMYKLLIIDLILIIVLFLPNNIKHFGNKFYYNFLNNYFIINFFIVIIMLIILVNIKMD